MKKLKISLLFTLLFAVYTVYGQIGNEQTFIDYNKIEMPASPNAASLGTYGDTPINTATGVPNINIPIYTLQVDGVSVPISISYHASGIQVNELATAVGLKWTLNAGGGIFRSVSSRPDEDGWLSPGKGPLPNSFYDNWIISDDYMQSIMTGSPPLYIGLAKTRDHNPDHYNYNFLSYSGKYITDFGRDVIKNQADELLFDDKTIKDQRGNTFYFGQNGYTENSNRSFVYGTLKTGGVNIWPTQYDYDPNIVTGWMLTTIHTKNNKTISFEYEPYHIEEYTPHVISTTIASGFDCSFSSDAYAEKTTTVVYNDYTVQLINKISSENVDIIFEYSPEDDELSTWKKKLTKITINDKVTGASKEFYFEYEPYNGDPRLKLKRMFEKKNNQELPGYSFDYVEGDLPVKYSFAQDFFGYFNGKLSNKSLTPYDDNIRTSYFTHPWPFGTFYDNNTGDRSHSAPHLKTGVLEIITYPTGGSTKFYYEPNAEYDTSNNLIKYCGGLRVNKIEDRNRFENIQKTSTYSYFDLIGQSLETNLDNIKTFVLGYNNNSVKQIFHSDFAVEQDLILNGYFYKKVITVVEEGGKQQKKESNFVENFTFGTLGYLLSSEKIFNDNTLSRIVEYQYDRFGISESVDWNILGHYLCILMPNKHFGGYDVGRHMQYTGNTAMLPSQITTTDYLKQGSGTKPVTVVQHIEYDPNTLLKVEEITDTSDEVITTSYYYPSTEDGFPSDFPKGLLIKKEVSSNKSAERIIFGQAMEYDNVGNVIKSYSFNKGEIGNTSSQVYVPNDYEEMTNLIYDNGKPVQVWNKSGEATTYIWGLKGQYPVAKIEGKARAGINQSLLQAVENATYAQLPGKLDELRNDPSVDGAMLTTYTYKPLAGVETITDPKNDKMTFHYDAFGRLDYVEDRDGNILSENEYHYRLQP